MAEKLTPQQLQAVKDRGGNLLVSAAAGSGKTKVLVDRLMDRILDPRDPADLDQFLMITYTKAAAAELRGKIAAKLTQIMAQQPQLRRLQGQLQRLYLTKISTVHSFCGELLRDYACRLDLPGDFRTADENECLELRRSAMEQVLEQAYETVDRDPDFRSFVDSQGLGRDDRLVPEILEKVYDSAMCHLDPERWLEKCLEAARVGMLEDAGDTVWGRYLMEDLFYELDLHIQALEECIRQLEREPLLNKIGQLLRGTVAQLKQLRAAETWDQVYERRSIDYGRFSAPRKNNPDVALCDRAKAVRAACKESLDRKLRAFSDPSVHVLEGLAQTEASVRGLVRLVRAFGKEYSRQKAARRVLDFSDLEHRTLDLLLGKQRSGPTAAAKEISLRFREIMVDEYQDSNQVQDAIFSALSRDNCFMVGDVKQSIYQFRLADPGIFLEKYEAYVPAGEALPGQGRKVLLSSNFRSSGGVLAGVNDVFYRCMTPRVGGLQYTRAEALREGIPHTPLGEPEVELHALVTGSDTYGEEAAYVADTVLSLLDGKRMVREGEQLRPIRPEDIAVLLRSPNSAGHHFRRALEKRGIRCCTGGGVNLLDTAEICALRGILQTVANPRQDIALVAALANPVFGFTADDLAAMRSRDKKSCIYDALLQDESPKARRFLEILHQLRRDARVHTLARLVERIFTLTRMDSLYAAMEGGEARLENLHTFYGIAADFESAGRRDLQQFLEHLSAMEDKGLTAAAAQTVPGAVTIMSIHKSKGLEFPVVILANLSREFNTESLRAQVLCDKQLGLGLSAVDTKNRIRYPTVAKRAIAVKAARESLSEELRVLYVAMTRARDRLIMTYAHKSLGKDLSDIALRASCGELLTSHASCPGQWVLQTAMHRTEAGELFALGGKPAETQPGEPVWKIRLVEGYVESGQRQEQAREEKKTVSAETLEQLRRALAFRYPHMAATTAPSKQTATQRKGRDKDQEAAQLAPETPRSRHWRKPSFLEKQTRGKTYGSATHAALQYIRYECCDTPENIRAEISRLVREGFLTAEQEELVRWDKLLTFFATDLGRKLRSGENVLREFKFSVLEDGLEYAPDLAGEQVLLQGVVDCALLEPDGITVIDFKTDSVTEQTLAAAVERYRPQVEAYAAALSRIFGLPVKRRCLYFFRLDRLAEL